MREWRASIGRIRNETILRARGKYGNMKACHAVRITTDYRIRVGLSQGTRNSNLKLQHTGRQYAQDNLGHGVMLAGRTAENVPSGLAMWTGSTVMSELR
jgi:hypothetical protein